MAKFYLPPKELGDPPPFDYKNSIASTEAQEHWVDMVKAWCKNRGNGNLRGEEWRWHVADGMVRHVILSEKPLTLIELPLGDGYHLDKMTARGLRLSDVRAHISFQKKTEELIAKEQDRRKNDLPSQT
jgi:hypothetical protein